MFGVCSTLSGLLYSTLPETLGQVLPDTIDQAEQLEHQRDDRQRRRKRCGTLRYDTIRYDTIKKSKGSPYSITERRVPELIPVLGSQHAGDVGNKPDGRLPLLSARPAVTPATLKRAATNFPVLLLGKQRHDGCEQFT